MMVSEVIQKVQLIEGDFTPSEANDVICALIEEKINFHKLQRLSLFEGDITANVKYPSGRIAELYEEKKIAKEFIAMARAQGSKLKINGTIEIELIEE
jgi:hypothetical protein